MSDLLNYLKNIYGDQSKKILVFEAKQIIKVSPSVFEVSGSSSSVSVQIVKVCVNGNLSVKALDSSIIKVVHPSQVRN